MKHTVAFTVLATWILIEPPLVWVHGSAQLFSNAPLSSWIRPEGDEGVQSFESEMECENYRAKELAAGQDLQHIDPKLFPPQEANMRCVRASEWLKARRTKQE